MFTSSSCSPRQKRGDDAADNRQRQASGSKDSRLSPLTLPPRTRTISSPTSFPLDNHEAGPHHLNFQQTPVFSPFPTNQHNLVSHDLLVNNLPQSAPILSQASQASPFTLPTLAFHDHTNRNVLFSGSKGNRSSSPSFSYDLNGQYAATSSNGFGLASSNHKPNGNATTNSPQQQRSSIAPAVSSALMNFPNYTHCSSAFTPNQNSAALNYFHQHHLPWYLEQQQQQQQHGHFQPLTTNSSKHAENMAPEIGRTNSFAGHADTAASLNLGLPHYFSQHSSAAGYRQRQSSPFTMSPSSMYSSLVASDTEQLMHTTETVLLTHKTENVINKLGQLSIQIQQLAVEASDLQFDGTAYHRANLKLRLVDKALDQLRSTILLLDDAYARHSALSDNALCIQNNDGWPARADENLFGSSFFSSATPPPLGEFGACSSSHDIHTAAVSSSAEEEAVANSINNYYDVDDYIVNECLLLTEDVEDVSVDAISLQTHARDANDSERSLPAVLPTLLISSIKPSADKPQTTSSVAPTAPAAQKDAENVKQDTLKTTSSETRLTAVLHVPEFKPKNTNVPDNIASAAVLVNLKAAPNPHSGKDFVDKQIPRGSSAADPTVAASGTTTVVPKSTGTNETSQPQCAVSTPDMGKSGVLKPAPAKPETQSMSKKDTVKTSPQLQPTKVTASAKAAKPVVRKKNVLAGGYARDENFTSDERRKPDQPPPPYTMYITNIPVHLNQAEICRLLEPHGRLEKILIGSTDNNNSVVNNGKIVNNGGFAFAKFLNGYADQKLLNQGYVVYGDELIVVKPYVTRIANKKLSIFGMNAV